MGVQERKQQETEIKQRDIIDAAERVFFSKGYENSSMDEVAREAEFSKRTVYVYFNSKEQIYYEIMIRGYRLLNEMIKEDLSKNQPQIAVEELKSILLTYYQFSRTHNDYFKAIIEYQTNEPNVQAGIENKAREECYQLGEQMFGYIMQALQHGIKDGSLRNNLDVHKTSLILWACIIGVFETSQKKRDYLEQYHNTQPEELIMSAFELIICAIRTDGRTNDEEEVDD